MRCLRQVVGAVLLLLAVPASSYAWWEFLEEFSGPGWWKGFDIDARLFCLADDTTKQERAEASKALVRAREAFVKLRTQGFPTPQRSGAGDVTNVDVALQAWTDNLNQWNTAFLQWERLARRRSASKVADIDRVFFPQGQLGRSQVNFQSPQQGPPDFPTLFSGLQKSARAVIAQEGGRNAEANTQAKIEYNAALSAYEREAKRVYDAASQALQAQEEATDALKSMVGLFFVPGATPGFIISACKLNANERRKAAFDIGMRFLWTNDDRYAGGQKIHLSTFEPTFSWRLIDDPRFDVVDYGVGAGFYWISSEAFPAIRGTFLEPLRLDFHAPTNWKYANAFVFRFGVLNFPAGFEPDVFLPRADVRRRIASDWVKSYGIYVDTEAFRKRKPQTATTP